MTSPHLVPAERRAEASAHPRHIVVIVYGADGEQLSRRGYAGSTLHVRELDDTLGALFRRWTGVK